MAFYMTRGYLFRLRRDYKPFLRRLVAFRDPVQKLFVLIGLTDRTQIVVEISEVVVEVILLLVHH